MIVYIGSWSQSDPNYPDRQDHHGYMCRHQMVDSVQPGRGSGQVGSLDQCAPAKYDSWKIKNKIS